MIVSENRIDEIISSCINEELRKVINESIAHSNCYGVPRGLLEYRKQEWENILIVENRSVAAYIYRNVINYITAFINQRIANGNLKDEGYNINENGTFIDLAKEFVIYFFFRNEEERADYRDDLTVINNGVVERVVISVVVNPIQHNDSLFSQLLFHEINHCKDDVERRLNGYPSLNDVLEGAEAKVKYQEAYANMRNDHIAYLIYSLFVDTELNAFVSQFYSELESSNTTREQFSEFFKNSYAYKRYDGFMFIIEQLEEQRGWEKRAMYYFNTKFKSVISFRNWFLGKAKYKASKFYNKICKIANLYYDTIEGKYNEQPM